MANRVRVFKRRTWRKEGGKYVPYGGARKTTVQFVETPDQARAICEPLNRNRPAHPSAGYYNFVWHEWERV